MMRKILLLIGMFVFVTSAVHAAKFPDDVREYIKTVVPQADIRFDGVIIFPDNTIYLPLYPSLFSDIKQLSVKKTYPDGKKLSDKPDILIFNNDFVLMKVLTDSQGNRTILHQTYPPLEVRTGLLPQDMLVPSGLIVPENIKGIIGNLKIDTKREDIIKVNNEDSYEEFLTKSGRDISQGIIPQLNNKAVYVTTNYSKNIQVLEPAKAYPLYSLAQQSIPIDVKSVKNGKFLLVTTYERPYVDIISVADSRFIKQIALDSNPEQILLDISANKAYVTSPSASTIYVIDLNLMALTQKIHVNGYCEHILLRDEKLFYVDKLRNDVWAIELAKDYQLKEIGKFPNISAIEFKDNKLFLASRTKSRVAVIDYETFGLVDEFSTVNKPVAMALCGDNLYVLGAQNNEIQKICLSDLSEKSVIKLKTGGFSSAFHSIDDSNIYVVTDLKNNNYSLIDLESGKLLKSYSVNIPLKDVIIADKVKLLD